MPRAALCVTSRALYFVSGVWRGGLSGVLGSKGMGGTSSSEMQLKRFMMRAL